MEIKHLINDSACTRLNHENIELTKDTKHSLKVKTFLEGGKQLLNHRKAKRQYNRTRYGFADLLTNLWPTFLFY